MKLKVHNSVSFGGKAGQRIRYVLNERILIHDNSNGSWSFSPTARIDDEGHGFHRWEIMKVKGHYFVEEGISLDPTDERSASYIVVDDLKRIIITEWRSEFRGSIQTKITELELPKIKGKVWKCIGQIGKYTQLELEEIIIDMGGMVRGWNSEVDWFIVGNNYKNSQLYKNKHSELKEIEREGRLFTIDEFEKFIEHHPDSWTCRKRKGV